MTTTDDTTATVTPIATSARKSAATRKSEQVKRDAQKTSPATPRKTAKTPAPSKTTMKHTVACRIQSLVVRDLRNKFWTTEATEFAASLLNYFPIPSDQWDEKNLGPRSGAGRSKSKSA
jgi:hypothetical protein